MANESKRNLKCSNSSPAILEPNKRERLWGHTPSPPPHQDLNDSDDEVADDGGEDEDNNDVDEVEGEGETKEEPWMEAMHYLEMEENAQMNKDDDDDEENDNDDADDGGEDEDNNDDDEVEGEGESEEKEEPWMEDMHDLKMEKNAQMNSSELSLSSSGRDDDGDIIGCNYNSFEDDCYAHSSSIESLSV